jgi:hypothetical protein
MTNLIVLGNNNKKQPDDSSRSCEEFKCHYFDGLYFQAPIVLA